MAGRRIDDHSFFAGKASNDNPLPNGCHSQYYDSAEGAGEVGAYQDTSPKIEALQDENIRLMKRHEQPPMRRN